MLKEKPLRDKFETKSPWRKDGNGLVIYSKEEITAFETLRAAITKDPILRHPDWTKEFTLHTDACKNGLGATLVQRQDGKERVISYASRSLTKVEKNYSVWEWESLAILWATRGLPHVPRWLETLHRSDLQQSRQTRHVIEIGQGRRTATPMVARNARLQLVPKPPGRKTPC